MPGTCERVASLVTVEAALRTYGFNMKDHLGVIQAVLPKGSHALLRTALESLTCMSHLAGYTSQSHALVDVQE